MKVIWEVDDGYAGPSRPQYTTIDESDLEHCETEEERQKEIEEIIQEEFETKITWHIKRIEE